MRRAIAALCAALALAVVVAAFTIVTPYALSNQPGPANPSFIWYVTYRTIPVAIIAVVVILLAVAWTLWRRRDERP